jgi:hypothetical protein
MHPGSHGLPPFGGGERGQSARDLREPVADVGAHRGIRPRRVARHERGGELAVEMRRQRRAAGGDVEQPVADQHVAALDHLAQQLAASDLGDLHVQLHVPLMDDEAQGRVVDARGEAVEQAIDRARAPLDRPPIGSRRPLREQAGRLRFERFPQLVELAHVGFARDPNPRAGARARLEEALLLQPPQGLRHWQDAHPQLGCDATSRHRRARRELSAQDLVEDGQVGAVGQGGTRCRSRRAARGTARLCSTVNVHSA